MSQQLACLNYTWCELLCPKLKLQQCYGLLWKNLFVTIQKGVTFFLKDIISTM